MTAKPGQGMQRPSLGGIGSRFDVRLSAQVCAHNKPWRLRAEEESKVVCGVCHPPADGLDIEWLAAA